MAHLSATGLLKRFNFNLSQKTIIFLACLAVSGLFWLLLSLSKDYTEIIRIPVSFKNIPEDMVVVNELADHVDAEVKVFGFDLLWYKLKFDKAQLALNAYPGKLRQIKRDGKVVHIILTSENKRNLVNDFDEHFQLLRISPDTLFIQLEPVFSKKVPVRLNAEMSFDKQYGTIEPPTLSPDSVLLTGQKQLIDTIRSISTVLQHWTGLKESVSARSELSKPFNPRLVQYSTDEVEVGLNVVEFTEKVIEVPVGVKSDISLDVKVFPSVVSIACQVPLPFYDKIKPDQFQVSVSIDSNRANRTARLNVSVDSSPLFVRKVRVSPAQVEYIIQK